jgi:uncharacterized protein (DUF433 family)
MGEDEYKALLAAVRKHARLVVEAAEDIDTRGMRIHVYELLELQQQLILLEMAAGYPELFLTVELAEKISEAKRLAKREMEQDATEVE